MQVPRLASEVATQVGGFPYYVHHVIDQLGQLKRQPKLEDVSAAVDHLLYDPHDPANLDEHSVDDGNVQASDPVNGLRRHASPQVQCGEPSLDLAECVLLPLISRAFAE